MASPDERAEVIKRINALTETLEAQIAALRMEFERYAEKVRRTFREEGDSHRW